MDNINEMSFIDHLEELRWNIIRSLIAIVITACVCFVYKDFIFDGKKENENDWKSRSSTRSIISCFKNLI